MNFMARYREWMISDYFDEETKNKLKKIEEDEKEIEDRFYKDLDFGTGGMRGKIGAGTNRINKYTIRKATQGLANYIINYCDDGKGRGVVIAYDSRHKSAEFALESALVLAGNGIKTYLFDELRPVPELSFAVRELAAIAGIVITASHNPPEYNGYKVYAPYGGQVIPEEARKITAEIEEINDFSLIKCADKSEAESSGLLEIIGEEIDKKYNEEMLKVIPETKMSREKGSELGIIYTPLHGSACKSVKRLLEKLGFSNLKLVEEQIDQDPYFSTVESPNPEDFSAFELALEMAGKVDPDLILGTDPDGDRVGLVVKDENGDYKGLNGNEVGILMTDYLLQNKDISPKSVIIKTIVTTEMVRAIAADYGVEVLDTLTGFKFIGEKIEAFENSGEKDFVLGFEESYGYLIGTYARDKDAVVACGLAAVMALHYQQQGKNLSARLKELRDKYGYYLEDLESVRLEGKEGQEIINKTLARLREEKHEGVVVRKDYLEGKSYNYSEDKTEKIDLPSSNVLQLLLEDESLLTIRPSGTEPKLKIYFAVKGKNEKEAEEKMAEVKKDYLAKINEIIDDLK